MLFFRRKVLSLSAGVGEPGSVKWDLALCLLLAWVIVYFCIWKGIRSSGKVTDGVSQVECAVVITSFDTGYYNCRLKSLQLLCLRNVFVNRNR